MSPNACKKDCQQEALAARSLPAAGQVGAEASCPRAQYATRMPPQPAHHSSPPSHPHPHTPTHLYRAQRGGRGSVPRDHGQGQAMLVLGGGQVGVTPRQVQPWARRQGVYDCPGQGVGQQLGHHAVALVTRVSAAGGVHEYPARAEDQGALKSRNWAATEAGAAAWRAQPACLCSCQNLPAGKAGRCAYKGLTGRGTSTPSQHLARPRGWNTLRARWWRRAVPHPATRQGQASGWRCWVARQGRGARQAMASLHCLAVGSNERNPATPASQGSLSRGPAASGRKWSQAQPHIELVHPGTHQMPHRRTHRHGREVVILQEEKSQKCRRHSQGHVAGKRCSWMRAPGFDGIYTCGLPAWLDTVVGPRLSPSSAPPGLPGQTRPAAPRQQESRRGRRPRFHPRWRATCGWRQHRSKVAAARQAPGMAGILQTGGFFVLAALQCTHRRLFSPHQA